MQKIDKTKKIELLDKCINFSIVFTIEVKGHVYSTEIIIDQWEIKSGSHLITFDVVYLCAVFALKHEIHIQIYDETTQSYRWTESTQSNYTLIINCIIITITTIIIVIITTKNLSFLTFLLLLFDLQR